jgi:hypothetical protein
MRNGLAYLLLLVCLASWRCGGDGLHARLDAATDPAPTMPSDGPPDAPPKGTPDLPLVEPDAPDVARVAGEDAKADVADGPGIDASDLRATDASDATPDTSGLLDAGGERTGNDVTVDKGGTDDRGGGLDTGAEGRIDTIDARAEGAPPVDAIGGDTRRDSGSDSSGQCNDLTADGPLHGMVSVDSPAPVPVGGTIEDGLYYETAMQVFGSGGGSVLAGEQRRMTMVIAGSLMQAAFTSSPDDATQWETDQMTTSPDTDPTAFGIKQLCPGSSSTTPDFALHYSFLGTGPGATFAIFYPEGMTGSGETLVLTLTKQ